MDRTQLFYGWKIVGVSCMSLFVSVGFIFYSYGAFISVLAQDLGASRMGVSIGLSLMNLATGLFAPFLGRALDRGSIRAIMTCGAVSMSIGFLLASRATALWHLWLLLASFLGLGAAMMGGVAASTLVANWFEKRRGLALGIATMGVSQSGVVMAPLAMYLVNNVGWRTTFLMYASVAGLAMAPFLWWTIVSRPEEIGLLPDGEPHPELSKDDIEEPILPLAPGDQFIDHSAHFEWSAHAALKEPRFWAIAMTVGLNFCAVSAVLTHMIPHVSDLGFSNQSAAYILAISAGIGVIGKVLFGWITDRMESRYAFWLAIAFQAAGVTLLLVGDAFWTLLLANVLFGFGMGGVIPLWGTLIGESFGRKSFGRVMGLMSPCMLPLQTLGVPFAGYVVDHTGSYDVAFATFLVTYSLSASLLVFVSKRAPVPDLDARNRLERA